jgi:type IV pilus assembly protein PilC
MPVYQYRARNRLGEMIAGSYETADKSDVVLMLREKGCYPVHIEEQRDNTAYLLSKGFGRIVSFKDLAVFCRQFATVVNAGVPILASLDILRKQTENTKLRKTLENLYEEVQKGKGLSLVMGVHRDVFPELLVNMVEAGEVSGTLDRVMERMATHYEKEYKINQKVKNALVYPSLIASVAIVVVVFLVTVVLPTFTSMFQQMGAMLPLSTRVLMSISYFIRDRWMILIVFLAVFALIIRWYSNTRDGREFFDALKLRIPVIGNVNKKVVTARFARTLGALMSSGIPLLQGIEVTKKVVGNTAVLKGMEGLEQEIKGGRGLAEPIKRIEVFPPMLTHMVRIGEDTGTLDYILEKTADFYDDEVEGAVNRMTTLLEPAIIMVMAVVVAFIVISIVLPMFDMMTQFSF